MHVSKINSINEYFQLRQSSKIALVCGSLFLVGGLGVVYCSFWYCSKRQSGANRQQGEFDQILSDIAPNVDGNLPILQRMRASYISGDMPKEELEKHLTEMNKSQKRLALLDAKKKQIEAAYEKRIQQRDSLYKERMQGIFSSVGGVKQRLGEKRHDQVVMEPEQKALEERHEQERQKLLKDDIAEVQASSSKFQERMKNQFHI